MNNELAELRKIRVLLEDIKGELGAVGLPELRDAIAAAAVAFVHSLQGPVAIHPNSAPRGRGGVGQSAKNRKRSATPLKGR